MSTLYIKTTTNQQVDAAEALDARGMIRDGFSMRTTHMMMDGRTVSVNFDPSAGAKDYSAVDKYRRELSDAWKNPDAAHAPTKAVAPDPAKVTDAYARYDTRLQDAWR